LIAGVGVELGLLLIEALTVVLGAPLLKLRMAPELTHHRVVVWQLEGLAGSDSAALRPDNFRLIRAGIVTKCGHVSPFRVWS
jgi:hypothetical protein